MVDQREFLTRTPARLNRGWPRLLGALAQRAGFGYPRRRQGGAGRARWGEVSMRTWIKDPLAIFADGAERGVVVEETRIAERVGAGATPERDRRSLRRHPPRRPARPRQRPSSFLPDAHPRPPRRDQQEAFSLARLALSDLVAAEARPSAPRGAHGADRASPLRLHHRRRPPLPLPAGLEDAVDIAVEEA